MQQPWSNSLAALLQQGQHNVTSLVIDGARHVTILQPYFIFLLIVFAIFCDDPDRAVTGILNQTDVVWLSKILFAAAGQNKK